MSTIIFTLISYTLITSSDYTINSVLNNITNPQINKHIFGVNFYTDDESVIYTLCRDGGEGATRFNWEIGAYNSAKDWYFIGAGGATWEQTLDPCIIAGQDILTQIPTMGWVAKTRDKVWSFSQAKYGNQTADECTSFPDVTWCARDAGSGIWLNGSKVIGNDKSDANVEIDVNDGTAWLEAIIERYGINRAMYFGLDNEPTLWSDTHWDVHPDPSTYEEIADKLTTYGPALKKACNNKCKILGYTPWGWCGYFTDGYDHDVAKQCVSGPHRQSHNNMPLIAWYLQQAANYEKQNGQRILDIMDVHYYPQASNVEGCQEDATSLKNRLQAPRSLYDWSYVDPSWINEPVALIPRLTGWINEYYPGTNYSISEYSFGDDTCQSSVIATAEALSVYATYGVTLATKWTAPKNGSLLTNAWNIYTNYDRKRANIYDKGIYSVWTNTTNIEMVTGYTFIEMDKKMVYVYLFNKDSQDSTVTYKFIGDNNINTNGMISLYGIDDDGMGVKYIANVTDKPDSSSFKIVMPKYSVRLAIVQQS